MANEKIEPFRYWTQAVLPLVYDDSLSYYELLCKVVEKLNETVELTDLNNDNTISLKASFDDLSAEYTQLQSFIDNYFDNLDVQTEINNKLDAMALDGTLTELITPFVDDEIAAAVAAWLEDNITPTTPAVDATLSVSGAAADAKVTGDEINSLDIDLSEISEDIPVCEITENLNLTAYGLTAKRENAYKVKIYGTCNSSRYLCFLNGQSFGAYSGTSFNKTLPAGRYKFKGQGSGKYSYFLMRYTYTTFANSVFLIDTTTPEAEIEFSADVMIGCAFTNGWNMGTENDPSYINIEITELTAVDKVARSGREFPIKMACFGDSIMYGANGNVSGGRVDEKYRIPYQLGKNLKIETVNYGVGSQGYIGLIQEKAYDNISSKTLTNFNAMIMCYGVNDGYSDLGTWNSTDETTIMGQFNKIIGYVFTQNPSIRLIVIAPYNGRNVGEFPAYWYGPRSHPSGYVSRQTLSDTLKQACEYYNIPYIEQTSSPINAYTIQTLIGSDGVHPSVDGYKQISAWLSGEIRKLIGV